MPKYEHLDLLESDPGKVRALCYDLVLNGTEIASGSIRINRRDIQERVMNVIGLTLEDAERKFGFLLEAFKYGAPPHGGFAPGMDRLVALMCGTNDIREVIAFPKNKQGENPMDGSPSDIDEDVKKELRLKVER
jgi:aspartyl-tRNA synthetase